MRVVRPRLADGIGKAREFMALAYDENVML
ncbi:hypothetical protein AvCA_22960 [Azotobacter vinelandii CA]|uniref:Uncharacterized protein n=2 Tax=Azotobacter vinelandii TaxID=354 RepID=C1DGH3_AZOVD|nr:hypothetical protein Avin_22960 [Azotobacter vinelandii DJ]AGK14991.1 hypothetical protein AvCA_22960 [Azotobacter vinelandii CA]AGK20546.1 hypothetical protein AvCA6_22960 [Azotobacter vinelandii CA6]